MSANQDDMPTDDLASRIRESDEHNVVDTTLKTSERVLARVTDGIYRQPGSALRELISNAYDADATRVVIRTDRPRFNVISIADDGAGMSPETLAHLLENIGGSVKRRHEGAELGVTDRDDPLRSPGGRRLIGRIGIGLFSVSQLTQAFQITTKVAGDPFRTVATVVMRQYGETAGPGNEEDGEYEAGRVKVWREPASDLSSHGTTISLNAIRPQTRRTLQSDAIWRAIEAAEIGNEDVDPPQPPKFHIGRVRRGSGDELRDTAFNSIPWSSGDEPRDAFAKLVEAVWDSIWDSPQNPKLSVLFDEYLRMVWQLALSVPLPYVHGHPFEIPFDKNEVATYEISGPGAKGSISPINLPRGSCLAEICNLNAQKLNIEPPFRVLIDDLDLTRPLRFTDLPKTSHQLKRSIIAVGRCREEFSEVETQLSGGPLAFEAYLLWNPKIAPTEHQGSLIRIHGASGTLFDASFMRFQVAEQTRRAQISCEIFVSEGLEGALNIDRESFNFAHPHVVFLTNWLHNALRRLVSAQKSLAAVVRKESRDSKHHEQKDRLAAIARDSWVATTADEHVIPPVVDIVRDPAAEALEAHGDGQDRLIFDAHELRLSTSTSQQSQLTKQQLATIASILTAYGVAEVLSEDEFASLLAAVAQVLQVDQT